MSGQPIHEEPDPRAPAVILERLPEREREFFLAQYHEAAQAAVDDVAGYKRLKFVLHSWSVRADILARVLARRPDYYEEVAAESEAVRNGTSRTVPIEEALAQVKNMSIEDATAYWQQ